MPYDMEIEDFEEDMKLDKYKKCIVVGGAGFIGSHLVDRLVKDGNEVIVVDDLSTGKEENINPKAEFIRGDISYSPFVCTENQDFDRFSFFEDADVVFHLAAKARVQPSIKDPLGFNKVNVNGLLNVLQACVDYGVKRFIYSSSSSIYGDVEELPTTETSELNPMSPYALQKLIGEQYCKLFSELHGIETACLRYFNVYGSRMNLDGAYKLVIPTFVQQKLNNKPMTIRGDGEQRRDFTYVGDVVEANILTAINPQIYKNVKCRSFNVGNGDNRSVNQIADLIGGDRVNVEPVIEPKETLADNNKIKKLLGWKPTMEIEDWIKTYKEKLGL
jgi:UDP-glucose 4-epimerase